ncbi:MAG: hypothetical protein EF812_06675 [Methanosarcinales archaeon]|nr:MAG: hypothetical protein EF812_06675 [Methanosarcinales archaeon]
MPAKPGHTQKRDRLLNQTAKLTASIIELLRITTKEIKIWPIVNMKGNKSSLVKPLINYNDFNRFQIYIEKVDYEFLGNSNEINGDKRNSK